VRECEREREREREEERERERQREREGERVCMYMCVYTLERHVSCPVTGKNYQLYFCSPYTPNYQK
jgi:hypothetical protein